LGRQIRQEHPIRGEVVAVRLRERALAFNRADAPGISPAQGKDQRGEGGGMNTGIRLLRSRSNVRSQLV
jgi:hypothetical protein